MCMLEIHKHRGEDTCTRTVKSKDNEYRRRGREASCRGGVQRHCRTDVRLEIEEGGSEKNLLECVGEMWSTLGASVWRRKKKEERYIGREEENWYMEGKTIRV